MKELIVMFFVAMGLSSALQGIFQEDLGKLDWKIETTGTDVLHTLFVVRSLSHLYGPLYHIALFLV